VAKNTMKGLASGLTPNTGTSRFWISNARIAAATAVP
jgi:hypothetical protein